MFQITDWSPVRLRSKGHSFFSLFLLFRLQLVVTLKRTEVIRPVFCGPVWPIITFRKKLHYTLLHTILALRREHEWAGTQGSPQGASRLLWPVEGTFVIKR